MSIQSLSYTLLKILAVLIFIYAVLPSFFSIILYIAPTNENDLNVLSYWIAQSLGYLILSLFLWLGANSFSKRISKSYSDVETLNYKSTLTESKIIEIGLILIGFMVVINKLPLVLNDLIEIIFPSDPNNVRNISSIIQSLLSLLIAVIFILGRDKISSWILKLRSTQSPSSE